LSLVIGHSLHDVNYADDIAFPSKKMKQQACCEPSANG
jgi:hypothetical protein